LKPVEELLDGDLFRADTPRLTRDEKVYPEISALRENVEPMTGMWVLLVSAGPDLHRHAE
jgi:hypothetical protein